MGLFSGRPIALQVFMNISKETELYAPVKSWLEGLGYEVKAEVAAADVVAVRRRLAGGEGRSEGCYPSRSPEYFHQDEEQEPIIVELKLGFSLTLLQQAVARQAMSDAVYVAVPRWQGRAGWRAFKANTGLCKRLRLGVLSVRQNDGFVQVHADPTPFRPQKSKARRAALLSEFSRREGDPNEGGTRGKLVTAYRQDAEKLVAYLAENGPSKGAVIARATGVARATRMMADNHYGWFFRLKKGIYGLSGAGKHR